MKFKLYQALIYYLKGSGKEDYKVASRFWIRFAIGLAAGGQADACLE